MSRYVEELEAAVAYWHQKFRAETKRSDRLAKDVAAADRRLLAARQDAVDDAARERLSFDRLQDKFVALRDENDSLRSTIRSLVAADRIIQAA